MRQKNYNDQPHVRSVKRDVRRSRTDETFVDRIAHKAHVVNMAGDDYEMIETKVWATRAYKMIDR